MTNKELQALIAGGESQTVEFKEHADKSLVSEVCAFANSSGGTVLIGVADDGSICGATLDNAERSRLMDSILKIEPRLTVQIEECDEVVVITVPEGDKKPYMAPSGVYRRFGANSQKLGIEEIVDFAQAEERILWDDRVNKRLPVEGHVDEAAYRTFLERAGISDILGQEQTLLNLHAAAYTVEGALCFTNGGALFFRDNARDNMLLHAYITCIWFNGVERLHIVESTDFHGTAAGMVDDATEWLKKNLLTRIIVTGNPWHDEYLELPEDALREAILNAVCHRDYFDKGRRIMVEVFDDRVDIVSPGGLAKGITPKNFDTESHSRNPLVTGLFQRNGYIERAGTGIRRMRDAMSEANMMPPEFVIESDRFIARFWRDPAYSMKSYLEFKDDPRTKLSRTPYATKLKAEAYLPPEKQAELLAKNQADTSSVDSSSRGNAKDDVNQSKNQSEKPIGKAAKTIEFERQILAYVDNHGAIQTSDVAALTGLSIPRAQVVLRTMAEEGALERKGGGRTTHYVRKEHAE